MAVPALDPRRGCFGLSLAYRSLNAAKYDAMCANNLVDIDCTAGALEVKAGSHGAHEEYWDRVSQLPADRKAGIGDWYLFEPEARTRRPSL